MLKVEDLSVTFGRKQVVQNLNFTAQPGACLAVLGRNGAGKTTLIRALAGLLPMRGKIWLDGEDIATLPPARRGGKIGYVAQDLSALTGRLSVLELLVLAQNTHLAGWRAPPDRVSAAAAILERFNITALAHEMPMELSGGQRQMVALALALVRGPSLLLLDEPTSALDIANQLHLLSTVRSYTAEHRIVTVMIVHDLNLVTRYADTALMLKNGTVASCGPVRDILTRNGIADIYGVDCHIEAIAGGHQIIYPLAPVV
jgi:iron complex transport system ATP-binding protein